MIGEFSLTHWLVVLVIVLIFFGPKRLPDLAKALGTSIRDLKKALNEPDKPTENPTQLTQGNQQNTVASSSTETKPLDDKPKV